MRARYSSPNTFKPLATESNVDLVLDSPASLPGLYGDRDRLIQVLTNLLSNAMKFTPGGGRITIGAQQDTVRGKDAVRFVVQDTGPGIPPDATERIFERFYRADPSRSRREGASGSGLGLAIVREIAAAHGGTVTAENQPTGGALFRVKLPGRNA